MRIIGTESAKAKRFEVLVVQVATIVDISHQATNTSAEIIINITFDFICQTLIFSMRSLSPYLYKVLMHIYVSIFGVSIIYI